MDNILFFVEGIHDANCIAKVLMINNFKSIKSMDELPIIWKNRIPRVYPFVKQRLDRSVQIPLYFTNNEIFIVIICCNGETNIIKDIDLYLSNMSKSELKSIKSICMIFDADQKLAKDAFEEKFNKKNTDMIINKLDFIRGSCSIKDEYIKLYYYFFPDNYSKGTLEDLLLSSASVVYPDLLSYVNEYIDKVDEEYKFNWGISSENKAKVGCISNIFQPGSANQNSIRYDKWISEESIDKCENIDRFYRFILKVIKK